MNAWRLILVPFLITLVLSVTSQSKGKFLWVINPAEHESNDGRILSHCGDNHGGYGFAYTPSPFKYMEEVRQYARQNKRGLVMKIYGTYG